MFYSLTGKIIATDTGSIMISCGGVGFRCYTTTYTLSKCGKTGDETTLYTYLSDKEDALDLYGFFDQAELDCFKLLITVSGVGPKAALAILSTLTPESLALSVAAGDSKAITKAPGVGSKIAQRIVLELKNKLASFGGDNANELEDIAAMKSNDNVSEAVAALTSLGYTATESSKVLAKAPKDMSVEDMIKYALRQLAKFN